MANTPGYVSNAELASRLSALVDRWNTRENQMIALLTQDTGNVTVTDGLGQNHTLPSFPQLQKDVSALTDELTGAVAQVRDMNGQALGFANAAGAQADRAEAAADEAAAQVPLAKAKRDEAEYQAFLAAQQVAAAQAKVDAATAQATAAANSATAAANSASAASTSATSAGSQASSASASASAASSHASTASQAKVDAQAARDKAALWADAPQGTEVEAGRYSARHWAEQAQAAVTGTVIYMGTWDASTGTFPASPKKGHFYRVTGAGTVASVDYKPGDQIIYNGSGWDKIDNTDSVTSVAGKSGAVTLVAGDVGGLGALATRNDVDWATQVTGKPATFPPATHTHSWSDIASGKPTTLGGYGITDSLQLSPSGLTPAAPADIGATDSSIKTGIFNFQGTNPGSPKTWGGSYHLWHSRRSSGGGEFQIAGYEGNDGLFFRSRITGAWSPWQQVSVVGHTHSAASITQDANNRFVTDAEKATWNGKQNALAYTPANKAGDTFTGHLKVDRGTNAADTTADAQVCNGGQYLSFHARLSAGSYNPVVQADDKALIFSNGTSGTGALFIGAWSANGYGLRLDGASGSLTLNHYGVLASNNALALGNQALHYAWRQAGVDLWKSGTESDRSISFWSYTDTGLYYNNPINVKRDAQQLVGTSTGWTIANSAVLTGANTNWPRLAENASMAASDFNAMNLNGWWMTANGANAPGGSTSWFMVDVRRHNDSWIQQEAYAFTAGAGTTRYRRHLNGGTWTAWTHNLDFRNVYLGAWNRTDANYDGLMAGDGSYMVMTSAGNANTYVGAKAGGVVYIRGNNNDSGNQLAVAAGGVTIGAGPNITHESGEMRVEGRIRQYYRPRVLTADSSAWAEQPRVFVQAGDPGAAAQDGDLWVW